MLMSRRPLKATRADIVRYFVGRDAELDRLELIAVRFGLNALVSGPRGSGRTTFLRAFEYRATDDSGTGGKNDISKVAYVDATGRSPIELATLVRERLLGPARVRPTDRAAAELSEALYGVVEKPISSTAQILRTLSPVGDAEHNGRVIVLLDSPSVAAAHVLFGQLRDQIWSLGLQWVVTTDDGDVSAMLRPPADAFFETHIHLEPLDAPHARALVRRRFDATDERPDEALLNAVVDLAAGNPRDLMTYTQMGLVDGAQTLDRVADARMAAQESADALSGPARELVEAMRGQGGVSASDERLQIRLGWSRSRLAQVLSELREAGVASTAESASQGGSSRRKLYTLVSETGR